MAPSTSVKKVRKLNSVLTFTKPTKNEDFFEKRSILLPKLVASTPAGLAGNCAKSQNTAGAYFPELHCHGKAVTTEKSSVLLSPVFGYKTRSRTPSLSRIYSPSESDLYASDFDDSCFSETTEASEIDSELLDTVNKEVRKRVIAGMVLTTRCGEQARDISEKNLGKRVEKFLGRSVPVPVISPKFPGLLTPLASPRQQRVVRDNWFLKEQKVSKVFSESLRAVYAKSREGKCRYIRAPLTPIPSADWVFESCRNIEMLSPIQR